MKFTILFLNLAKIHNFIPKSTEGGGDSTGLGNIPKKTFFGVLPLQQRLTASCLALAVISAKKLDNRVQFVVRNIYLIVIADGRKIS